jgi:hypothetical protein
MSDLALRPTPLLGHWVPGLIVTALSMLWVRGPDGALLISKVASFHSTTLIVLTLAVLSYAVGELLDSLRDLAEDLVDWEPKEHIPWQRLAAALSWLGVAPLRWEFLVTADERHRANFEEWYFTYYLLDGNLAIGLLILAFVPWWWLLGNYAPVHSIALRYAVIGVALVFLLNGGRLRQQMRGYMALENGVDSHDS